MFPAGGADGDVPLMKAFVHSILIVSVVTLVNLRVADDTMWEHPALKWGCAALTVLVMLLDAHLRHEVMFAGPCAQPPYHIYWRGRLLAGPIPQAEWARWRNRLELLKIISARVPVITFLAFAFGSIPMTTDLMSMAFTLGSLLAIYLFPVATTIFSAQRQVNDANQRAHDTEMRHGAQLQDLAARAQEAREMERTAIENREEAVQAAVLAVLLHFNQRARAEREAATRIAAQQQREALAAADQRARDEREAATEHAARQQQEAVAAERNHAAAAREAATHVAAAVREAATLLAVQETAVNTATSEHAAVERLSAVLIQILMERSGPGGGGEGGGNSSGSDGGGDSGRGGQFGNGSSAQAPPAGQTPATASSPERIGDRIEEIQVAAAVARSSADTATGTPPHTVAASRALPRQLFNSP